MRLPLSMQCLLHTYRHSFHRLILRACSPTTLIPIHLACTQNSTAPIYKCHPTPCLICYQSPAQAVLFTEAEMPSLSRKADNPIVSSVPISIPSSSNNREIAVSIVFGVFAVAFAIITIWQGHRWWHTFSRHVLPAQGQAQGNGIFLRSHLTLQ